MNKCKWLSDVPTYATNKRFDKELRAWTYDIPARDIWDTKFPEELILLARDVSEREQNDPEVINDLWKELNKAITESGGVQMSPIKMQSFYDIETREWFFDVWVFLKTKGGWHE